MEEEKQKFLSQFLNYEILENRFYKTIDKNNITKYHYIITNPTIAEKIEEIGNDISICDNFILWDEKFKSKNFTIFTYKKEIITIVNKIKSYCEELKNNKIILNETIIVFNQEKMCRNIMSQLYDIMINLENKKDLLWFSLYNLNTIAIEEEKKNNKNKLSSMLFDDSKLIVKLNPIEYITTNLKFFSSGTLITQSPKKQDILRNWKYNQKILFEFAVISRFILTWEIRKHDVITIPCVFSNECQEFLKKCYLDKIKFQNLRELDFLNMTIEFQNFHFSKINQINVSSFISSIIINESPHFLNKINSSNISLDNPGYSILKLSSFCIKPGENENEINKDKQINDYMEKEEELEEKEALNFLSIEHIYSYPISKK